MTLRYFVLGGAAAIALGAFALSQGAISATTTTTTATRAVAAPARATLPLDKVNHPATELARMQVENAAGQKIGTVFDVVTRSDGKALIVTVDASAMLGGSHRLVGIEATKLGLDQGRRVLVASLTRAQVKALPSLS